ILLVQVVSLSLQLCFAVGLLRYLVWIAQTYFAHNLFPSKVGRLDRH
uniref:Protein kinase domain-containing protein n=1 Tax=Parascaris univalens TaxID=6257 RepID=A0A915BC48_PARUN